jgi:hypothetical protein
MTGEKLLHNLNFYLRFSGNTGIIGITGIQCSKGFHGPVCLHCDQPVIFTVRLLIIREQGSRRG